MSHLDTEIRNALSSFPNQIFGASTSHDESIATTPTSCTVYMRWPHVRDRLIATIDFQMSTESERVRVRGTFGIEDMKPVYDKTILVRPTDVSEARRRLVSAITTHIQRLRKD